MGNRGVFLEEGVRWVGRLREENTSFYFQPPSSSSVGVSDWQLASFIWQQDILLHENFIFLCYFPLPPLNVMFFFLLHCCTSNYVLGHSLLSLFFVARTILPPPSDPLPPQPLPAEEVSTQSTGSNNDQGIAWLREDGERNNKATRILTTTSTKKNFVAANQEKKFFFFSPEKIWEKEREVGIKKLSSCFFKMPPFKANLLRLRGRGGVASQRTTKKN